MSSTKISSSPSRPAADNRNKSNNTPSSSSPWSSRRRRRAPTRRAQLWMKHSLSLSFRNNNNDFPKEEEVEEEHNTSHHEHQDDDETTTRNDNASSSCPSYASFPQYPPGVQCANIDQALFSLHEDYETPIPAFVVSQDDSHRDWIILDGLFENKDDEHQRSQELLQELTQDPPELTAMLRQYGIEEEGGEEVEEEGEEDGHDISNDDNIVADGDDDDDDEFGDFQEAPSLKQVGSINNDDVDDDDKSTTARQSDDAVTNNIDDDAVNNNDETSLHDDDLPMDTIHVPISSTTTDNSTATSLTSAHPSGRLLVSTSIYHVLPLTDVTSPEGRFTRRLLLQNDDQDDNNDDDEFFNNVTWNDNLSKVDATLRVLESTPWDHVPLVTTSHSDLQLLDDFVTRQLSQLDASHVKIQAKLMKDILQRKHLLTTGNRLIRELDRNLEMAKMYAHRTQESLRGARGNNHENDYTGIVGSELLLREFDRRDQYRELGVVLTKCATLVETEQCLQDKIESFAVSDGNYGEILSIAASVVKQALQDEHLSRLDCLEDLRHRARSVFDTFRLRIDSVLRSYVSRVCQIPRSYNESEYESLVRAAEEVHRSSIEANAVIGGADPHVAVGSHQRWSQSIHETLCFQADKCFARALLDPTDAEDSEYDKDLIQLGFELRDDNYDTAKLLSLTHNLVTIRFGFETDRHYLPMVYHRMCVLLTDVLHCHDVLMRWHSRTNENDGVATSLAEFKMDLWTRCEEALAKCLDRYLHTAGKIVLFPDNEEEKEGRLWREDLETQHGILQLTKQFRSLGREFLGPEQSQMSSPVASLSEENSDREIDSKLYDLFRRHLRAVHVAGMNSTGMMLYREDWRLITVPDNISSSGSRWSIEEHLLDTVKAQLRGTRLSKGEIRYWHNGFLSKDSESSAHIAQYDAQGNPFLALQQLKDDEPNFQWQTDLPLQLCGLTCLGIQSDAVRHLATRAIADCVLKWVGRLLSVAYKLPLIADDVCEAVTNLGDLYFTTAFRLCAGSARNEDIILGAVSPTALVDPPREQREPSSPRVEAHRRQSSGSIHVGFGRRPSKSKIPTRAKHQIPVVPRTIDAEICAPLSSDIDIVSLMRKFIERGQRSLEGIVNLQKIEQWMSDPDFMTLNAAVKDTMTNVASTLSKRAGAAWSCLFVAETLCAALFFLMQFTEDSFAPREDRVQSVGETPEESSETPHPQQRPFAFYVASVRDAVPRLVDLASQISSVRAIMGRHIVREILAVDSAWEASQINEQSNDYVEGICDRIAAIWMLNSKGDSLLPLFVRHKTFEHMVEGGYLSLLEGFSRVPFCSTEGRSLMSMDLSSFENGIRTESIMERVNFDSSIVPPTPVIVERGKEYVDAYVKVFYFPEDDIMKWIVANHSSYQMHHCLSLLTSGAYDRIEYEDRDISGLLWDVKKLYRDDKRSDGDRRT